jgi:hypothetical protein
MIKIIGYGWCAWAESAGFNPLLTKSLLEVNDALINNNPIIQRSSASKDNRFASRKRKGRD